MLLFRNLILKKCYWRLTQPAAETVVKLKVTPENYSSDFKVGKFKYIFFLNAPQTVIYNTYIIAVFFFPGEPELIMM